MHGTFASKFLYLLILGGIVGILLLASVGRLLALHRLRTAVEVTGRIVGKRIDRDDGTYYCVTYAFEDGAGASRQKEIQLRKASFDSLVSGERIRVRYESTNPENSYLAESLFMRSHTQRCLDGSSSRSCSRAWSSASCTNASSLIDAQRPTD